MIDHSHSASCRSSEQLSRRALAMRGEGRFAHGIRMPWATLLLAALILMGGCGGPNQVNIELRKQKQDLEDRITTLERQHDADVAAIRGMESRVGTLPTLPQDRLAKLYTVHGIELGRLTGPADLDPSKPDHKGFKVQVSPIDQDGEKIKAAGSFTVEAFDLALPEQQRIGCWEFDLNQAKANWVGFGLIHAYMLPCPWQQKPQHEEITIKVTFRDELTQRVFEAQQVIKLNPAGESR